MKTIAVVFTEEQLKEAYKCLERTVMHAREDIEDLPSQEETMEADFKRLKDSEVAQKAAGDWDPMSEVLSGITEGLYKDYKGSLERKKKQLAEVVNHLGPVVDEMESEMKASGIELPKPINYGHRVHKAEQKKATAPMNGADEEQE